MARPDAAAHNTINNISPQPARNFPKMREAIMESLVDSVDGLAIQYWMLWATVIVAGFATWNIWTGKHHQ
jgi:hypothetical protein